MALVRSLLALNQHDPDPKSPLVEVVVMSRNSPETGVRILKNIRRCGLDISRSAFTGGESVVPFVGAFKVDLFMTTNVEDAQKIIDEGECAAAIVKNPPTTQIGVVNQSQVRIAFDGDAVLFDESSELVYQAEGLDVFHKNEDTHRNEPMSEGPYAQLLKKLARLQDRLPFDIEVSPIRIAIVTARNSPAEIRVITTLRHWGVYVDAIFFLGGMDKSEILRAYQPHIFFDDQDLHLENASKHSPSARVPHKSDSPLNEKDKN